MADKETVLFAIDGVLVQLELARKLAMADEYPTASIDAVVASVTTLRSLIDTTPEGADINACQHPAEAVRVTAVGGGSVTVCSLCNEIIRQT